MALRALQRDRERRLPSAEALADSIEAVAIAEGIDASPKAVADLLAELCPADEVPFRGDTPSDGEKLNPPSTGSVRSVATASDAALAAMTEEANLDPIIELRHPKAVAALQQSDAGVLARARHRALTGRAAMVVGAVAAMMLAATQLRTCMARLVEGQPMTTASRPAEPNATPASAREPMPPTLAPSPLGVPGLSVGVAPEPPMPKPMPELLPAGEAATEASLRVVVEGSATYVVDGRTERAGSDGNIHLSPGHHRITVSSTLLAFPRILEVDLRARESATRTIVRGRGSLRLAITPSAEVTVDGHLLGVTPLQPIDLGEGTHLVALHNGDLGVVVKRRVVVTPEKETLLELDLITEKQR